jgi:hypothetical protein
LWQQSQFDWSITQKETNIHLFYLIRWGASQVQFFLFSFLQQANLIGPSLKKK